MKYPEGGWRLLAANIALIPVALVLIISAIAMAQFILINSQPGP